jgi:hypothetical protein
MNPALGFLPARRSGQVVTAMTPHSASRLSGIFTNPGSLLPGSASATRLALAGAGEGVGVSHLLVLACAQNPRSHMPDREGAARGFWIPPVRVESAGVEAAPPPHPSSPRPTAFSRDVDRATFAGARG